jgi:hypothetical protein
MMKKIMHVTTINACPLKKFAKEPSQVCCRVLAIYRVEGK